MKVVRSTRAFANLMVGTSLAAIAMPAAAQDAGDGNTNGIGEIVVTAQKREQNLQDVPIAISAIGSEKLEQLQVTDSRDLSGLAPNVTVVPGQSSSSAAVISIRGITTPASETFGLDTANALYVDGIYIARSGASGLDVTEIERVEVLRGPQGTLFGRNTTGGAIAFISRAPDNEFGIRGEAGYGNFNAWNGKLAVDTGRIGDALKATFSYSHRERDGTVDNILEPDASRDPGSRKSDAFRAAIRVEPSDSGYIQYIFDWTKSTGNPYAFQVTNVADATFRPPLTVNGVQISQTQQAPVAQYLAGATFLEPGCAALAVPTREYRDEICLNTDELSTDKIQGHNFQAYNDFGGIAAKLTSGYRKWDSLTRGSDFDGVGTMRGPQFTNATLFNGFSSPLLRSLGLPAQSAGFLATQQVPTTTQGLFDTNNVRRHEQFSTELEITGDSDMLDWVVGGFYFWEKGSEDNPQTSGFVLDTNTAIFGDAAFVGVLQGLGFPQMQAQQFAPLLAPSFRATNPARYRLVVTPAKLVYSTTSESKAVYGQVTVYPGGRDSGASITAGGRYTWDDKSIVRRQNGVAPHPTAHTGANSFSKFTWNVMGRYEFNPDVSVYARVATGYRSGGYNASDPVPVGTTTIPSFDEESVMSYEIGLKTELFNRRLRFNVAAYHNQYDDLAINVPVLTGSGTFQSQIVNAGKVNYTGVEADFIAALSDNFSVDGSIGYVDVKYKEFNAGQPVNPANAVQNIAAFARAGYTSPLTGNIAFNAVFPIGGNGMELRARVGYTHEDGKYSFNNAISSPFNDQIRGDDSDMVDAQLVLDNIPVGKGEARLMIWGKNLTDDNNLVRGIDFGPLGYAGGIFNDPRTYGVTVGFKY